MTPSSDGMVAGSSCGSRGAGHIESFDVFVLSDTRSPDVALAAVRGASSIRRRPSNSAGSVQLAPYLRPLSRAHPGDGCAGVRVLRVDALALSAVAGVAHRRADRNVRADAGFLARAEGPRDYLFARADPRRGTRSRARIAGCRGGRASRVTGSTRCSVSRWPRRSSCWRCWPRRSLRCRSSTRASSRRGFRRRSRRR